MARPGVRLPQSMVDNGVAMSPKVVILGGGYAGISAAKRLARQTHKLDVALVNPRPEFVERIRLHQYVAGNHQATTDLGAAVPRSTKLLIDTAQQIDPASRQVHLSDKSVIDYDYLIYAVGSRDRTGHIDGAQSHALTLGTYEAARDTRARLNALPDRSPISVVGGGLTGVETAAELAALGSGHTVHLITDTQLAPSVGSRARSYIREYLTAAGVVVVENTAARTVAAHELVLADGSTIPSDLTVIAGGAVHPELARNSQLNASAAGALMVGTTLTSTDTSNIVGAGDAALVSDHPLRMSCQAAIPSGIHAAETVLRMIDGREPKPLRPKFTGQAVSLGRKSGVLQSSGFDDQPRPRLFLTGSLAAFVKERVCRNTIRFGHFGGYSYSWSY